MVQKKQSEIANTPLTDETEPISIDEIKKGDTITLIRWTSHKDRSWVGDLLNVKEVCPPFVFVEIMSGNKVRWKYRFNANDVIFGRVTDTYIENMIWLDK